jgi:hypothetical protein
MMVHRDSKKTWIGEELADLGLFTQSEQPRKIHRVRKCLDVLYVLWSTLCTERERDPKLFDVLQ